MKRARFLELAAASALAGGRALDEEISAAVAVGGRPSPEEARAVVHAREGRLADALSGLGVDPLVVSAATIRPQAALEVSRRIAAVGAPLENLATLATWTSYVALVLVVEVLAFQMLERFVAPVLYKVAKDLESGPMPQTPIDPLWLALAFLAALVGGFFVVQARAATTLRGARVLAAAAGLVASGARADELAPLVASQGRAGARVGPLLAANPGVRDLQELSGALEARAALEVDAAGRALRVLGVAAIALPAAIVLLTSYGAVYTVAGGVP